MFETPTSYCRSSPRRIDREVLEQNPRLRGVANHAVGYDNVDLAAATELGIPVSNTPGVLTETTADLTWALLLSVSRRVPEADAYMRAGRYRIWGPQTLLGADVGPGPNEQRKVLGIVGFGRIGQAVARRARGFEMDVVAHDPKPAVVEAAGVTWLELDRLLVVADFVCLHPGPHAGDASPDGRAPPAPYEAQRLSDQRLARRGR